MNDPLNDFDVFKCQLNGRHLIEASAGTGKTYTITSLYVRILLETTLNPADILVVTFTEAATAELKQRIRNRVRESIEILRGKDAGEDDFLKGLKEHYEQSKAEELQEKLDKFDEASIYTIHAFCNRLLTELNVMFGVSADFEMLTNGSDLLQDAVDEFWRSFLSSELSHSEEQLIDLLSANNIGPEELAKRLKIIYSRPYAEVIPEPLDLESLSEELAHLNNTYQQIKSAFEQEERELKSLLFGNTLNGNKYRSNKKDEYYGYFLNWISQDRPSIDHFIQLDKFGQAMPSSVKKGHEAPNLKIFQLIDQFINRADVLKGSIHQFISLASLRTKEILNRLKEQMNVLTYDDLLGKVWSKLNNDPGQKLAKLIAAKYPIALVDEFQDTDPVQYEIFDKIYSFEDKNCLFMIGDPKQSIYGFRGADIYTYIDTKKVISPEKRYGLFYNYRSNNGLLNSYNRIFSSFEDPFILSSLQYQTVQSPENSTASGFYHNGEEADELYLIRVKDETVMNKGDATERVSDAAVNHILKLLDEKQGFSLANRPVAEKDIAVLVRDRFQGELVQNKLREAGLFSVLRVKDSIYQSYEAKELLILLSAVLNFEYEPFVKAALSTDYVGMSFHDLNELSSSSNRVNEILSNFQEIREEWFQSGISSAMQLIESYFEVQKKLGKYSNAYRKLTNYRHLKEQLLRLERGSQSEPAALLKTLSSHINDPGNSEAEEIRLENDEDLIQIITIHASKGLEFPVVINPFLWTPVNPPNKGEGILYLHKEDRRILDIRKKDISEDRKANELIAFRNDLSESVRLMYVALTRAKNACVIFLPDYSDLYLSPIGALVQSSDQLNNNLSDNIGSGKPEKIAPDQVADLYHKIIKVSDEDKSKASVKKNWPVKELNNISEARTLNRDDIYVKKKIISYSWLNRLGTQEEVNRFRDIDDSESIDNDNDRKERNPFNFPKGALSGSLLHDILEFADFSNIDALNEIIIDKLEQYNFDSGWANLLRKWIWECLNTDLGIKSIKLTDLEPNDTLKEMEFHFPIRSSDVSKIYKLLQYNHIDESIDALMGYLKGFVDLIFRWEGKYYIADYKSNYLGDTIDDYYPSALKNSIRSSKYDIQYHIYTVALDKFLSTRVKEYNYEKHFGGVFYLYLRGMKMDHRTGIYFDRPDAKDIESLSKILSS
ncbi:exodeoxyribonuclease V subunit beta [Balneola sp. MJW-20]|uniref:exodeoxyribonuclease V subunit beta n=1 Tax=Gracilimonas aurantiaca TaxID=3234185 RepID=UPI0034673EB3